MLGRVGLMIWDMASYGCATVVEMPHATQPSVQRHVYCGTMAAAATRWLGELVAGPGQTDIE